MECNGPVPGPRVKFFDHVDLGWGGGGLQPRKTEKKKPKKTEKKTVPNLKFAVVFGFFRFFLFLFGFLWCFLVFFGLNFDKKFQPFKSHVNNEFLGGQELPNKVITHLMPIKPCKCLIKAIITNTNHLTTTR